MTAALNDNATQAAAEEPPWPQPDPHRSHRLRQNVAPWRSRPHARASRCCTPGPRGCCRSCRWATATAATPVVWHNWHGLTCLCSTIRPSTDAWYFDAFDCCYARAVLGVLAAARALLSIGTVAAVLGVGPVAVKAVRQLPPDFLPLRLPQAVATALCISYANGACCRASPEPVCGRTGSRPAERNAVVMATASACRA